MGLDGGHGALAGVASTEPLGQKPAWCWGRRGGSEEGEIVQTKSFVVCCCQGEQGQVMVVEDGA